MPRGDVITAAACSGFSRPSQLNVQRTRRRAWRSNGIVGFQRRWLLDTRQYRWIGEYFTSMRKSVAIDEPWLLIRMARTLWTVLTC